MVTSKRIRSRLLVTAALVFAPVTLTLFAIPAQCQEAAPGAIRLFVQPLTPVAEPGKPAEVSVELRDVYGTPVSAPRAFRVKLDVGGKTTTVTIPAGASKATTPVTPEAKGILEIRAANPEMLPGGGFLKVAPARTLSNLTSRSAGSVPVASEPRPQALPSPAPTGRSRAPATEVTRVPSLGELSSRIGAIISRPAPTPRPPSPPPSPAPAAAEPTLITLRASPDGEILANGKDASHIHAFVLGDVAPRSPVDVTLVVNAGRLDPQTIRIPSGATGAEATLTSETPTVVSVEFVNAHPAARLEGDRKIQVAFVPPVAGLQVEASPNVMTLLDEGEVAVRLVDEHGTPVASNVPRKVSLVLSEGRGTLAASTVEIGAGEFEQRVKFTPTWRGTVVVKASTSGLLDQKGAILVTAPLLLLGLSAGGGALGGILATFKKRSRRRWLRVVVGVVAGFFLYWLAVFGLSGTVPRAIAINPISAVAVAILGGWLGTGVLDLTAKRLGLKD